ARCAVPWDPSCGSARESPGSRRPSGPGPCPGAHGCASWACGGSLLSASLPFPPERRRRPLNPVLVAELVNEGDQLGHLANRHLRSAFAQHDKAASYPGGHAVLLVQACRADVLPVLGRQLLCLAVDI